MNLYVVFPRQDNWDCYVFSETANKAKAKMVNYFSDDEAYIDFRCKILRKDVGGNSEICEIDCQRLADLEIRYLTEEEIDPFEY